MKKDEQIKQKGAVEQITGDGLSPRDLKNLATLETKLQLARDYVNQVADGRTTGMYLYGKGGIGKSYNVLTELERQKSDYKVHNSRMTGRGLFDALAEAPDSIHVLEDMEQLLRDRNAQGVLRSALWGQRRDGGKGPMERPVKWSNWRQELFFVFSGGIIMIANRPLDDLPELMALRTRIACMQLQATDGELTALMRRVSLKGFEHQGSVMTPAECTGVCEFLIEQSRALDRTLDMRMLVNSFMDHLAWRECDTGCHWHDMVATRLKERPITFKVEPDLGTRAERKQRELAIAREVAASTGNRQERLHLWQERTGKSEQTLYRRLAEVGLS